MSDMYTWMAIMENGMKIPFKEGEAVQISKKHGGGVGQFAGFSPERGTVTVNIKGSPQEFNLDDIVASVDPGASYYDGNSEEQRYDDVDGGEHYLPDPPVLQAGQPVQIDNMYGSGNGSGHGVFVAYGTDGTCAICNVDGADKSIPIEYVILAPSECDAQNFADTGNDGSLSPMSFGDEQRIDIEKPKDDSTMDEFEKWMSVIANEGVEDEAKDEEKDDCEDLDEAKDEEKDDCDCGSYDCETCFPSEKENTDESVMAENEVYDTVYELAEADEEDEDFDDIEEALNELEQGSNMKATDIEAGEINEEELDEFDAEPDAMVDVDDGVAPDVPATIDSDMGAAEIGGASDDVSELIAKIAYIQDMGMSLSDKHFDTEKLTLMRPEMVQRVYSKVTGEVAETASMGGIGAGEIAEGPTELDEYEFDREGTTGDSFDTPGWGDEEGELDEANIESDVVNDMINLDVDSAKAQAVEMIQGSTTTPRKQAQLISNVGRARQTKDVVALLYNMILAGEGLGTVNSKWAGKYNEDAAEEGSNINESADPDVVKALKALLG